MATTSNTAGDIEAGPRESQDTKTYQSTILPGGGQDFIPEAHHRLLRQLGNPAPLGLSGFALTTFVLSLVNVHARSVTVPNIVIGIGTLDTLIGTDSQPLRTVVSPNSAPECGNLLVAIPSVLWRSALTVLSGSVSHASLSRSSMSPVRTLMFPS